MSMKQCTLDVLKSQDSHCHSTIARGEKHNRGSYSHLCTARELDGQLRGPENMQGLGPLGQGIARGYTPDEGALPGLAHAKVAGIQHSKTHLHQQAAPWSVSTLETLL